MQSKKIKKIEAKIQKLKESITHLGSFNATQNGTFMFENPALWGMPDFGSTAVVKVLGYAPSAGAGIAVAPTA